MGGGILSVPNGGIVVCCGRDDDGAHDGGDVEGGPLEHEILEHHLLAEALISPLLKLVLHGDAAGIVDGLWLVSVVVGLDQKPSLVTEFIKGVHSLYFSLNHCSLADTRNDVVDRCSYFHSF